MPLSVSDSMPGESALARIDSRPFFERVLAHGLDTGLIGDARVDTLKREGAKAIVQLAAFFGTANLRPELEAARLRLVTLVSLALEADAGGRPEAAVSALATKSLLTLSKSGADRLRALLKLPEHDILEPPSHSAEAEKAALARWTFDEPISFARYLAERRSRENRQALHELSYWLGGKFGLDRDHLQSAHVPCDSIINSVLLVLFAEKKPKGLFSAERFRKLHAAACKKRKHDFSLLEDWRAEITPAMRRQLDQACQRFTEQVLPLIRKHEAVDMLREQERFSGLFFFDAADIEELTHHDKAREKTWRKITGGKGEHTDVQCTVLLMVATGLEPTPSLRKKDAVQIWRNFTTSGFDDKAVTDFIENLTPFEYQADIRRLWQDDLADEARLNLDNEDQDHVLAYLHDTCRAGWKAG